MLSNMRAVLNRKSLELAEEIKSSDLKEAHTKRVPGILKKQGVAKITRYGKTEYYLVSPDIIQELIKRDRKNSPLDKLRERYKKAQLRMQSPAHAQAFNELMDASAEDINSSVKVGSH